MNGSAVDDDLNKSRSKSIRVGNGDSEFTLVVGDRSKVSSDFGLECISTIGELSERIANLARNQPSLHDDTLFGVESHVEKKEHENDVEERKLDVNPPTRIVQSTVKKPLLVELHTFPGFDDDELTPLPSNLNALFILKVVTKAKKDLRNKPYFKKILADFFLSTNSQAILQDAFWWHFCHKYQPAAGQQEKLFDRIAKNYTSLFVTWTGSIYKDKLFKDYPDLMSQAVYSTFCHAFPTSCRQFDADFRDGVLSLTNLWMMGTKPSPRTWDKWNFEGIEPNEPRKAAVINEDIEEHETLETELDTIQEYRATTARRGASGRRPAVIIKPPPNLEPRVSTTKKKKTKKKKKDSVESMMQQISSVLGLVEKAEKRDSCAAEGGPTFERVVFNLYGRSPLLEHFLGSHRLLNYAGTSVLVQRTEIAALPPLCAETYQDVIDNVKTNSKQLLKKYQEMSSFQQKEYQDLVHKHEMENYDFTKCSEKLLSNAQEVRKLCELLRTTDGYKEIQKIVRQNSGL